MLAAKLSEATLLCERRRRKRLAKPRATRRLGGRIKPKAPAPPTVAVKLMRATPCTLRRPQLK
jgi:hypothetical protein